uniref:Uncharacterized protein n=1 Tax=Acrobeloides nanus TaxID=290746 RepID=A0A914DHD7_9BILA
LLQQIEHFLQLTPTERPTITAIKEKAHQMNAICGQNEEEAQRYAPTVQEILFGSNFSM